MERSLALAQSLAHHWQGSRYRVRPLAKVLLLVRPSSMFRPLDLLPMSQRRILAVRQCVELMLSGAFTDAPPQNQQVPTGRGSWTARSRTYESVNGDGRFTLPGNSLRGEADSKTRQRTHGHNLTQPEIESEGSITHDANWRSGLSEFRFSAEASVTHEINSRTKLPTPSIQAEASLSYEDREEEAIIAAILGYEN
jgi:hypothetical protein